MINPDGAKFPQDFRTETESFKVKGLSMLSDGLGYQLLVGHPAPGDWFAIAFLDVENNRIEQKVRDLQTPTLLNNLDFFRKNKFPWFLKYYIFYTRWVRRIVLFDPQSQKKKIKRNFASTPSFKNSIVYICWAWGFVFFIFHCVLLWNGWVPTAWINTFCVCLSGGLGHRQVVQHNFLLQAGHRVDQSHHSADSRGAKSPGYPTVPGAGARPE